MGSSPSRQVNNAIGRIIFITRRIGPATDWLPDERALHATELAAGHHASRRAHASLRSTQDGSEDRRSRPRNELRLTNGWRDERANGCRGREIVCRSESCGSSKKRTESFYYFLFFQIAHAIQFKGTVQLIAAKSRQALMSWRWLYIWRLYFSFVRDLRSRGNLLSDTEFGDPLGKRPARGDLLKAWGSREGRDNRGSWEGAWGSPGGILPLAWVCHSHQ